MMAALFALSVLAETDRGDCWSNIGGYAYDFHSVAPFHTVETYSHEPYTDFIKLCGNLSASELPASAALLELYDASVVRCKRGHATPVISRDQKLTLSSLDCYHAIHTLD
jgi:hypothetical protein